MGLEREIMLQGEIDGIAGFTGTKEKCPECSRETDEGFCAVHAEVEPVNEFSMSVKIDGEKVKLGEDHFSKLVGMESEKVEALPQNEKMSFLRKKLEGLQIRVIGNRNGGSFYAEEIDLISG
jgi:hypothetical protein